MALFSFAACGEEDGEETKMPWEKSSEPEKSEPTNAATPEFTKKDSDELREEKWGNGQNKAQGHVRRDASDNYVRVGPWKFWYRKGAVKESGSYVDGKKQGRWESWHSNGQKESERHYKADQEHGSFSVWKKSGQLRETGVHKDGQKDGIWKRWYKSNAQQEYERNYASGAKTGRWIEWRKNGQKKSEINYANDLRNGETSTWFKSGQRESQGTYKNDMKHGKWLTWYRKGQKKMEAEFNLGEKIPGKVKEWTSKGKELDPERVRAYIYGRDSCPWTKKAVNAVKESGFNYVYRRTDKSQKN